MNYLNVDILLLLIAINIIVHSISLICFLTKKQEPKETEKTEQKETEKEKTDSINILNEKVCIFLKDYNENSANVEVVLDRPKSFLIRAFPSIEYNVLDMVILTIECNEKYEKLLKTYSNYCCADIYYLRNSFQDFFIQGIEKTKYNEIIFKFVRDNRRKKLYE